MISVWGTVLGGHRAAKLAGRFDAASTILQWLQCATPCPLLAA